MMMEAMVMSNTYFAFFELELKSLTREPVSLFFMVILPIIITMVFGGAFGHEATEYGDYVLGIDTVVPVNIVFLLANIGLMGIPITITELKDQEALKRYIAYPVKYRTYFASLVSAFAFVGFLSTLLFSVISFVFYGASWFMSLFDTILLFVLYLMMIVIFNGLGFLIALLVRGSRTANLITTGVFISLIFTSGVAMPVDHLPVIIQRIAAVFPMHHCIRVVQLLWISEFNVAALSTHIIYVILMTIAMVIFLGKVKVKWDYI